MSAPHLNWTFEDGAEGFHEMSRAAAALDDERAFPSLEKLDVSAKETFIRDEIKSIWKSRLKQIIFYLGIPIYACYVVVEFFFFSERFTEFFLIRLASCSYIAAGGYLLIWRLKDVDLSRYILFSHSALLLLSAGRSVMMMETTGAGGIYYTGIIQIMLGSLLLPYDTKNRLISLSIITLPFVAFVALSPGSDYVAHALHFISILVTAVIGAVVGNLLYNTTVRDLSSQYNLQHRIRYQDFIIERKSAEMEKLRALSRQFSDNVIRFMQSGGEKSIRPTDREVAILYFDIAQSTEAIGRLDMAAYQKAIDSLFKIVIRVLQKSDMTISNFSGDGGMAIANAPNAVANYRKTAIDAAFDILAAVADRQKEFEEEWGAEFAIRIGVASGSGRVGFFPNEGFGLYTALGEVVNLSERLCSSAPANSVALLRAELRSAGYGRAAAAAEPLFSASELKGLTSLEGVVVAVSASDARTLRGTTA